MIQIGEVANETAGTKSFNLFTGPINYEVVAINPNLKELEAIGITWMKQEPNYAKDFGDSKATEVVFWIKALDEELNGQLTQLRYNISHDNFVSGAGKAQFIDMTGRCSWANSVGELIETGWFPNMEPRQAKRGEELLHKFINCWLRRNTSNDAKDVVRLNIDRILKGDFKELQNTLKDGVIPAQEKYGKKYGVCLLTGVTSKTNDEGKTYHNLSVFNKQVYSSAWSTDFAGTKFKEFIEKSDYNKFGTDNNPVITSFDIKQFDPSEVAPDTDDMGDFGANADPMAVSGDPQAGVVNSTPADDLPF